MLLGLPSALSYTALQVALCGVPLLDLKDFVFGTVGMITAGLGFSLSVGWRLEARVLGTELRLSGRGQRVLLCLLKVVIPLSLLVTLVFRVFSHA